jgi:D-glycero-D-manno-heptose 1,7-bisphosphate phosphatase
MALGQEGKRIMKYIKGPERKHGTETKVVFLDRDGTICESRHHESGDERNYVTSWEDFVWIPGSKEAIIKLLLNDYFVIVVSNQACIGKGIINTVAVGEIAFQMWSVIDKEMGGSGMADNRQEAGKFRVGYYCPHLPEDECVCRKPKPGLIYHAACDWNLSLKSAWMVGDSQADSLAGWRAGIRKLIRVGKPETDRRWKRNELSGKELPHLQRAVEFILEWDGNYEQESGTVKALSIQEPWLTMIVDGKKTIETRTWTTRHRGDLLLVGSKKPEGHYAGRAACLVNLVDCRDMHRGDEAAACCPIYPGAKAWVLENVRKVEPVSIRGQRGLYDVDKWQVQELGQGRGDGALERGGNGAERKEGETGCLL